MSAVSQECFRHHNDRSAEHGCTMEPGLTVGLLQLSTNLHCCLPLHIQRVTDLCHCGEKGAAELLRWDLQITWSSSLHEEALSPPFCIHIPTAEMVKSLPSLSYMASLPRRSRWEEPCRTKQALRWGGRHAVSSKDGAKGARHDTE